MKKLYEFFILSFNDFGKKGNFGKISNLASSFRYTTGFDNEYILFKINE